MNINFNLINKMNTPESIRTTDLWFRRPTAGSLKPAPLLSPALALHAKCARICARFCFPGRIFKVRFTHNVVPVKNLTGSMAGHLHRNALANPVANELTHGTPPEIVKQAPRNSGRPAGRCPSLPVVTDRLRVSILAAAVHENVNLNRALWLQGFEQRSQFGGHLKYPTFFVLCRSRIKPDFVSSEIDMPPFELPDLAQPPSGQEGEPRDRDQKFRQLPAQALKLDSIKESGANIVLLKQLNVGTGETIRSPRKGERLLNQGEFAIDGSIGRLVRFPFVDVQRDIGGVDRECSPVTECRPNMAALSIRAFDAGSRMLKAAEGIVFVVGDHQIKKMSEADAFQPHICMVAFREFTFKDLQLTIGFRFFRGIQADADRLSRARAIVFHPIDRAALVQACHEPHSLPETSIYARDSQRCASKDVTKARTSDIAMEVQILLLGNPLSTPNPRGISNPTTHGLSGLPAGKNSVPADVSGQSLSRQSRLRIIPSELDEANAFVELHHRHLPPVTGHKFSLAVVDDADRIRGVAIVGRPVSRMLDDGWTLEITRVATDGCPNACSALYGAARRATFALGYLRVGTYNLPSESGASLRAAGFRLIGEAGGGRWSRKSRPRVDKSPTQTKLRWEASVPVCEPGQLFNKEEM